MSLIEIVYNKLDKQTGETVRTMRTCFDDNDTDLVSVCGLSLNEAVHNFFIYGGHSCITFLEEYESYGYVIYVSDFYYSEKEFDMDYASDDSQEYDEHDEEQEYNSYTRCDHCRGDKEIMCSWCTGSGNGAYGGECSHCEGNGYLRCNKCKGIGYY